MLTFLHPVNKCTAVCGTRKFTTEFTRTRRLFPRPCITKNYLRSILVLSSHLRLGHSSGLFPRSFQWSLSLSGFPTKTLYCSNHKIQAINQNRRISNITTEWLMGITTADLTLIFTWCFALRTAYVLFKYRCALLWIQSPDCQFRS